MNKGHQNIATLYSILFLNAYHQNKALNHFHKRGQHQISRLGLSWMIWSQIHLSFGDYLHVKNLRDSSIYSEDINDLKTCSLIRPEPFFLKKLEFTPCKAEQPLRGMELQERKLKKEYRIQKICLERTYI